MNRRFIIINRDTEDLKHSKLMHGKIFKETEQTHEWNFGCVHCESMSKSVRMIRRLVQS